MLILSRKTNQKIRVEAPRSVKVFREEIYDEIQRENKAALATGNIDSLAQLGLK